ncbi:MAG: V-type ATP synthase subunit K [Patescibacteria group bacterium]|nr:V-type ATP synthase subunit K [Patescibacteria group bacterium]
METTTMAMETVQTMAVATGSDMGLALAIAGAAASMIFGGMGSAMGMSYAGQAGAGVVADKPEVFGKVLLLEALPGSQGIYGFLGAFWIMLAVGLLGDVKDVSIAQGLALFFAALPVAFTGLTSGMFQGKVSAAAMNIIAKDESQGGKGVILSAMVETYAILGLLITILLIGGIKL